MRKTPQQKKADSYAHDRRNAYGENDKASRKAIPLNKAIAHRKVRRKFKDVREDDTDGVALKQAMRKAWKKSPDKPLGEHLENQKQKRAKLVGRKDVARAEYAEFLKGQAKLTEERLANEKARAKAAKKKAETMAAKAAAKAGHGFGCCACNMTFPDLESAQRHAHYGH